MREERESHHKILKIENIISYWYSSKQKRWSQGQCVGIVYGSLMEVTFPSYDVKMNN